MAVSKRRQDYADKKDKRVKAQKVGKHKHKRSRLFSNIRFAILTLALIAGFIYVLLYVQNSQHKQTQGIEAPVINGSDQDLAKISMKPVPKIQKKKVSSIVPQPQFQFYTMLTDNSAPGKEVDENASSDERDISDIRSVDSEIGVDSQQNLDPLLHEQSVFDTESLKTSAHSKETSQKMEHSEVVSHVDKVTLTRTAKDNSSLHTTTSIAASSEKQPQFLLQLGIFKSESEAKTLRARLLMMGFDPKIVSAGSSYRVVVGPYRDEHEARMHSSELKAQGVSVFVRRVQI